jgi:ABC-type lipoprotein export system ATPase subunit
MSPRHRAGEPAPSVTTPIPAPVNSAQFSAHQVRYERAGRVILDEVSMTARPGGMLALVGPSGSGKSSLLALLAGLEEPDSGSISRPDPGRSRIGLILQGYGLVGVLTAAENVEIVLQSGALGRLTRREIRARTATVLAGVGLSEVSDHLVQELSGGQQQRVAIARALVIEPDAILADELTAELDQVWQERIVQLLVDATHRGVTVILATHDVAIAERCDQVVRLQDGRAADHRPTHSG